jgi:predicted dehydrogenase
VSVAGKVVHRHDAIQAKERVTNRTLLTLLASALHCRPSRLEETAMDETYQGNRRIRYAVIGLGHIAQVAICRPLSTPKIIRSSWHSSRGIRKAHSAFEEVRDRAHRSYDSVESVLRESQADAVYIALPNTMHRSMTERVAAVLCEKPMAMTVEDCEAIVAGTRAQSVKLMIA